MRHPFSLLGLIVDLLRSRKDRQYEMEYLGYESYPSTNLSTVKAPAKSGPEDAQQRKAA
jgi:hypothetical protein